MRKVFVSYYHGDQQEVNKFVNDFSNVCIFKLVDCLEKCLIYGHIRRFAN